MSTQAQTQTQEKTTIFDLVHKVYEAYVKASRKEELQKMVQELIKKVGADANGITTYEQWDPEEERITVWIGVESVRNKLEEVTRWLGARSYSIIAVAPYECKKQVYNDNEKKLKEDLDFETCGYPAGFDIVLAKHKEAALVIRFFYDEEDDP